MADVFGLSVVARSSRPRVRRGGKKTILFFNKIGMD
jgi:hypothetical protein